MRFIEEVVVEEFLPTFRSLLAGELRERDLTQSEVADLLGISQSAVSKYAHGEVEVNDELAGDERVRELVGTLADGLADDEMTRVQALVETEVLIRRQEVAFPPLAKFEGSFDVHDPDGRLRTTERVRASVRRGVATLENTGGFAVLIPAVGSNLVEALPDATTVDDVAAVPGRIIDVKGKATVPGEPEFGVSGHVASVLLAARDAGSPARAALNVRYEPSLVTDLEDRGHETAEFDVEADLEPAVAAALADGPVDVLYQTGGFGVEPICYVLGADAGEVVAAVRELRR